MHFKNYNSVVMKNVTWRLCVYEKLISTLQVQNVSAHLTQITSFLQVFFCFRR